MNTPAHLIIGAAALARRDAWAANAAVVAGSLAPDASLYFMVFWNRFVVGMSEAQIFGQEYFSDFWQQVFAIDNSVFIWGGLAVIGYSVRSRVLLGFALAGLLHLALDFPLHHDDGRAHFWPVSDWIFASPVSYWDWRAHGNIVGPIEVGLCIVLAVVLWRRFGDWWARGLVLLALAAEATPFILFRLWFGGPSG